MSFLNPSNLLNQFGVPNYIQNGNFEAYDTFAAQVAGATKWNAYKDAAQPTPVDGTGGTPTVIRNASVGSGSQLRGTRSWQITKTGNAQGEGYSQDFTIDPADKSQLISISFDFNAGSAYTTGDLAVFIYDVTNSVLITPSVIDIPNGAGLFRSTFTATTSTNYRIIFHCATSNATTTNWSVTIDNIQVSKNEVVTGAAVTDWQSFTPTGSWTTNTTYTGQYRRVGDSAQFIVAIALSGTPNAANLTINLPSDFVIDTTKLASGAANVFGTCNIRDNGIGTNVAVVNYNSTTSVVVLFNGTNNTGFVNATNPIAFGSGDNISLNFTVPIANWSSNANFATSLVEYAFNTSTTDADDTTSFGYGAEGTVVPTIAAATGTPERRTKRVRFQTPIQPTDIITIEFQVSGSGPWTPVGVSASYSSFMSQGASEYGIGFRAVSGSTTDIDVDFWKAGRLANNATYAGAGASYPENPSDRWRVRKSAGFTNALAGGSSGEIPAGSLVAFAGSSAPSGYLLCDGSAVSRTTYANLFSAIGVNWGSGDGSTTFNLPDMRGAAPAGAGTSTGYTQNETITFATKHNDQMQGHQHNGSSISIRSAQAAGGTGYFHSNGGIEVGNVSNIPTGNPRTDGTNGTPRTGNITRGKVVGVNFIIKT